MMNVKYFIQRTQSGDTANINPTVMGNAWLVKTIETHKTPNQEIRALGNEFKQNFQCEYDSNTVFETLTYPQADRVIKFLHGRGDKMAIATNKRSGPTKALLKYYKWETFFEFVACIDQFANEKTKSDMVGSMLRQYPLFKKSYFVGDTLTDGYAAKNNKLNFVKAKYGYGDRQNWDDIPVHKSIDEIAELMLI